MEIKEIADFLTLVPIIEYASQALAVFWCFDKDIPKDLVSAHPQESQNTIVPCTISIKVNPTILKTLSLT